MRLIYLLVSCCVVGAVASVTAPRAENGKRDGELDKRIDPGTIAAGFLWTATLAFNVISGTRSIKYLYNNCGVNGEYEGDSIVYDCGFNVIATIVTASGIYKQGKMAAGIVKGYWASYSAGIEEYELGPILGSERWPRDSKYSGIIQHADSVSRMFGVNVTHVAIMHSMHVFGDLYDNETIHYSVGCRDKVEVGVAYRDMGSHIHGKIMFHSKQGMDKRSNFGKAYPTSGGMEFSFCQKDEDGHFLNRGDEYYVDQAMENGLPGSENQNSVAWNLWDETYNQAFGSGVLMPINENNVNTNFGSVPHCYHNKLEVYAGQHHTSGYQ